MNKIEVLRSGVIYRNPKPHVYSLHGAHPSVVCLGAGKLVASAAIGQAFESADTRAYLFFSEDDGETWTDGVPFNPELLPDCSDMVRLSLLPDNSIAAVYHIHDRSRVGEGYTNPETQGFVDTHTYVSRSCDGGHTWEPIHEMGHPIKQPIECQSSIFHHPDGRWFLPTSTFKCWDGSAPDGLFTFAIVSEDEGKTWPKVVTMFDRQDEGRLFYESGLTVLPDGKMVAVAWDYDDRNHVDLPVKYAVSEDGESFSDFKSTGILGQTTVAIALPDGKLLAVYRRLDKPGLYSSLVTLENGEWEELDCRCLWSNSAQLTRHTESMSENFAHLKFGAPRCIIKDGKVFLVFWCYEDYQGIIRYMEIDIK